MANNLNIFFHFLNLINKLKKPVNKVNFTLAFTALISARFINWKKERMDLKSETVRNTYLSIAFFTVLYALYKAFPHQQSIIL